MYHRSTSISLTTILVLSLVVKFTSTAPLDSKTSSFNGVSNAFESSPFSSSSISSDLNINEQPAKSEISETVSKILRLMHSLSNKSILITPAQSSDLTHQTNHHNLNEVKRDSNLKFKSFVETKAEESNRKLSERLNKFNFKQIGLNKFINENLNHNENANKRSTSNDRYRDFNFNEQLTNDNSNENNDNNLYMRERSIDSPLTKEYVLFTKYPSIDEQPDQRAVASNSDFMNSNQMFKFNEMIRKTHGEDESSRSPINNLPALIKQFSRLNEKIELENSKENHDQPKSLDNGELEHFEEQQLSKDHKKNLYDMVENEDEDNLGEEEHNMHNYNISLLSDRELNRTLMDIQWLLNQNLSKQDMASKFSSKGRNNRNRIAQRMEYFEKLYRNNHHLSPPTNVKRGEGPQLSVVSPLDILRDKLILELARRKIEQSKSQMKENEDYLKKIG